jgi:hypothetical protein
MAVIVRVAEPVVRALPNINTVSKTGWLEHRFPRRRGPMIRKHVRRGQVNRKCWNCERPVGRYVKAQCLIAFQVSTQPLYPKFGASLNAHAIATTAAASIIEDDPSSLPASSSLSS